MRLPAGYHSDIPMADYLADPCEQPALSSQTVDLLYRSTAKRAHMAHARLGNKAGDFSPRADKGSAVHALVHGGYPLVYVEQVAKRSGKDAGVMFEPQDWKTQDAQDERDRIRAAGGIPLLPKERASIEAAGVAARNVLGELGTEGKHEQTMIFQIDGVWCRSRADWMTTDKVVGPWDIDAPNGLDLDTKTVIEADEITWIKQNADGCLAQLALRYDGHVALGNPNMTMGWLLQEIEAPYDSAIIIATPEMLEQGSKRVRKAVSIWNQCLATETWPGKPRKSVRADLPSFVEWESLARGIE